MFRVRLPKLKSLATLGRFRAGSLPLLRVRLVLRLPNLALHRPRSLTGTWSGPANDSSGPGQMTWQVTRSGTSISGDDVHDRHTSTKVTGRGTVSGTVSGSSLQFTVSVLAGGFDSPYSTCSASVSGNATISSASVTGTYDGSSSCSGAIASGQLTLNKQ